MRLTLWRKAQGARAAVYRAAVLAAATVPLLAACNIDRLLESSRPSVIDAENLEDPRNANLLMNGVAADFECGHGAFVAGSALMGDELEDAQLAAAVWDWDRRTFNSNPAGAYGTNICNAQLFGVYRPLSTARWAADELIRRLEGWSDQQVPDRMALIARAAVYAGFSLAELGMIMCSGAIDVGPEIQSDEFFRQAEARFTRAIEAATTADEDELLAAAYAGRARVRLYLGNRTGAAADAALVPPDFVFNSTAANDPNGRRWNRIFHFVNFSNFHMVEAQSRDLRTGGVLDPRTAVTRQAREVAIDGRLIVEQNKYTALTDPLPITRYEEAQLIIAEVQGGQTAVNIINALRAAYGLPQVSSAEQANLQQTIIEERRRELWLEGQRLYDIRRFSLPLIPAPGTSFPKGGQYGPTVCLPLPDVERFNNPQIP